MELVLDGGEKFPGDGGLGVVIDRSGVDVGDFLVKPPLAGPDLPDAFQQFLEIVSAKDLPALLQALVVHHEALDEELLERPRCPDPELGRLVAVDPVADGDDGVEVVETGLLRLGFSLHGTVGSGCFQNGNNLFFPQFSGLEDVFQVLVDRRDTDPEQVGHEPLGEPEGFLLKATFHLHPSIGTGVEEEFAGGLWEILAHGFKETEWTSRLLASDEPEDEVEVFGVMSLVVSLTSGGDFLSPWWLVAGE